MPFEAVFGVLKRISLLSKSFILSIFVWILRVARFQFWGDQLKSSAMLRYVCFYQWEKWQVPYAIYWFFIISTFASPLHNFTFSAERFSNSILSYLCKCEKKPSKNSHFITKHFKCNRMPRYLNLAWINFGVFQQSKKKSRI